MNEKTKQIVIIISIVSIVIIVFAITGVSLYTNIVNKAEINFDTAIIVSVILACFSIWISLKCYFAAAKANNNFYNKSYDYMRHQSITLGRIEERFGEKFNNVENILRNLTGVKVEIKENDTEIEKVIQEKNVLIAQLNDKLDCKKQDELKNEISEKIKKIDDLSKENRSMYKELTNMIKSISDSKVRDNIMKERLLHVSRGLGEDIYNKVNDLLSKIDFNNGVDYKLTQTFYEILEESGSDEKKVQKSLMEAEELLLGFYSD